jgi:hypothetical protein
MKIKKIGCELGTIEQQPATAVIRAPRIKMCAQKPAIFVRSKRLGSEVAVCKKCFAFLDSTNYEFKENFEDNPKAEY